jgi:CHAD domain-containing protein
MPYVARRARGMAFRIKRKERVDEAVRRIVRAQLRSAIRTARDDDQPQEERVHDVRTRLKRSRAALALIRRRVGKTADRDDRRLRDAARRLARPRDLAVQAHTFRVLGTRLQAELPAHLLRRLAGVERQMRLALSPDEVERELRRTARALRRLRRRLGDWEVGRSRRAVGAGVTATYRRARRGFRDVRERPTPKRFHDWRKQVKALFYELRIVGGAIPELGTTLVPKVEKLADVLGQVHDLDCAKATAELHPRWFGRVTDLQAVLTLLEERRTALEAEALALAETVFAGRARDVRALVEIGWQLWRRRPSGPARKNADGGGDVNGRSPHAVQAA